MKALKAVQFATPSVYCDPADGDFSSAKRRDAAAAIRNRVTDYWLAVVSQCWHLAADSVPLCGQIQTFIRVYKVAYLRLAAVIRILAFQALMIMPASS